MLGCKTNRPTVTAPELTQHHTHHHPTEPGPFSALTLRCPDFVTSGQWMIANHGGPPSIGLSVLCPLPVALDGTPNLSTGVFTFDLILDFSSQEQCTLLANEKPPWAFSWTPPTCHNSHRYDTPSSSLSVSTFFTPSNPINIPASARSRRGENRALARSYTGLSSAATRLSAAQDHFGPLSPHLPLSLKRFRRTIWSRLSDFHTPSWDRLRFFFFLFGSS